MFRAVTINQAQLRYPRLGPAWYYQRKKRSVQELPLAFLDLDREEGLIRNV